MLFNLSFNYIINIYIIFATRNNGSDIVSILTLMEQDHKQSQPQRSIRKPIIRRRFEIEGGSVHDCSKR